MVRQVRYSFWVALGWIFLYLWLWLLGAPLVMAIVAGVARAIWSGMGMAPLDLSNWWLVPAGGLVVFGWVRHSRRYWKHLLDRSPQIELHPTFLRAKQLHDDILWKDVQSITGRQSGIGSDQGSKLLYLYLVGGRCVALDLVGLNIGMERLYALASAAREADAERRLAGEVSESAQVTATAPEPVPAKGNGADELGKAVERFGPLGQNLGLLGFGVISCLGMSALCLYGYQRRPEELAAILIPWCVISVFWLPMIVFGVKLSLVRLVLYQDGLRFVASRGRYTLRYIDIRNTSSLLTNGKLSGVQLMLRDGQVVQVSGIRGIVAAAQRIEDLRSAATSAKI